MVDPLKPAAPTTGPLRPAAPTPKAETKGAKSPTDALSISVDARVKLGEDKRPEVVLEGLDVTNAGDQLAGQIESNMKGRRKGQRSAVTQAVVAAIAEAVAKQLAPVLQAKLGDALAAEHLPPEIAAGLVEKITPEIAKAVAAQLSEQVKTTYSLGF